MEARGFRLQTETTYDREWNLLLDALVGDSGEALAFEHGIFAYPTKLWGLRELMARLPSARRICEIGFNTGGSALLWLLARPDTTVLAFDLGHHSYVRPAAAYLQARFGAHWLRLVLGDSKQTVPAELATRDPSEVCDVLFVDGGHTVDDARSDLRFMAAFANPAGHVLLVDDTDFTSVGEAWKELVDLGFIEPLAELTANLDPRATNINRGPSISVGVFLRPGVVGPALP